MTNAPLLAGHILTDGQRPGRVGLVVTRRSETYVVTAARVYADPFTAHDGVLSAHSLIVARRAHALGGVHQPIRLASRLDLLDAGVYRISGDGARAPGRVTALHGSVSAGPNGPIVTGTLEVSFLPILTRSERAEPMPTVSKAELGSLVMTYDGSAVGLIVAGTGHTAVIAPIDEFLKKNQYELAESAFSDAWDVGLDSIYNDLNGVRPLRLGEMPEAA